MTIELYLAGKLERFDVPDRQTFSDLPLSQPEEERPNPSQDVPDPWDVPTSR
jgi:hypothetical protein